MEFFEADETLDLDSREIEKKYFEFKHEYEHKYDHDRKGKDVRRDG